MLKFLFFFSFFIVFYTYIGYGILLYLLVKIKRVFSSRPIVGQFSDFEPEITLVVAAYNEARFIKQKIINSLALQYPAGRLHWIFITDGSTDETPEIISRYDQILLLHQPERKGKVAALNRARKYVDTPLVIFSDANTLLNPEAVNEIVKHYDDFRVGGVAGEKKIIKGTGDQAASTGESFYWKYESLLKKLDSEFHTVVGAAGELFSLRTALYEEMAEDIIIEDFVQSLRVSMKGYVVRYEPKAYAIEAPSSSMKDEQERKVRIIAGGFQAMQILKGLFNIFRFPVLSFQFISHRILRWTLCPVCLIIGFLTNFCLVNYEAGSFYIVFLLAQIVFYAMALLGWIFAYRRLKMKIFYIPYYFLFMNLSVFLGFHRFIRKKQPAVWKKAER
jgi:poly-beta-1,6-N-acetyl-D-glucosamine synthase